MRKLIFLFAVALILIPAFVFAQTKIEKRKSPPISKETESCVGCHKFYTPGIVEDWMNSLHSKTSPSMALKKPEIERRISSKKVDSKLENVVVGCYECHSLNTDKHRDSFDHMGYRINVVVSINDCSTCHPVEASEYSGSKKAHASGNLTKNPVYHALVETVISKKAVEDSRIIQKESTDFTKQETCFSCHGTEVKVKGLKEVETKLGKIKVPDLINWPNQGVGRINPDGSMGACTACHPRHSFSIKIARKPETCGQCHLEPDVPAYNVYKESKHGNIYASLYQEWDFNAVPWKAGKDFQAPTCSACHNSLITAPDGKTVIAERTHDFGSRLWIRLFGLVYSHPQPKQGDTSIIRNKDGLPLPTTFTGEPATDYLISQEEQSKREAKFKNICKSCHSTSWVNNHFEKMDNTVKEVDSMILASTLLLVDAWKNNLAEGLPHGKNPFDETVEQMWIRQWLFYANSIKYASAMTGAPDYSTFKNGWWNLTENLQHMRDWIELKKGVKK
ncbi:MAG: cytochrome c3 family protein [Thermodesulfovibrionales bacterium]|nr:cytochrome c3 family protein [Thermodesulfovibrionales bacterium]